MHWERHHERPPQRRSIRREIDKAADETSTSKDKVFLKALMLYFAARYGKKRGLKLGLVEPSDKLETEFVGL